MDTAQIRAILGDAVQEDGRLDGYLPDICGHVLSPFGQRYAKVTGVFSVAELEAIAAHMRAHTPPIDTATAPAQTTTTP